MNWFEFILTPINNQDAILNAFIGACLGLIILTSPPLSSKISLPKALVFCLTILVVSIILYNIAPPKSLLLLVSALGIAGSSVELIKTLKQIKEKDYE